MRPSPRADRRTPDATLRLPPHRPEAPPLRPAGPAGPFPIPEAQGRRPGSWPRVRPPALEPHSQAEAGEEFPFSRIEILEIRCELLILAGLISHLAGEAQKRQAHTGIEEPEHARVVELYRQLWLGDSGD